jgi:preprotein translocase subunit YajC
VLADVLANAPAGDGGGFSIINLLLPLALAFLIFTMFRRQRKSQQQVKEMRTQMEPGTQVMTQFGLFGTILSVDQENNKAVLELSPGNTATVHTQALAKVVEQTQEPVAAEDARDNLDAFEGTTVPDDASSLEDADRPLSTGTAASAGTAGGSSSVETPEESIARLERERSGENPDARGLRDPKANPDN